MMMVITQWGLKTKTPFFHNRYLVPGIPAKSPMILRSESQKKLTSSNPPCFRVFGTLPLPKFNRRVHLPWFQLIWGRYSFIILPKVKLHFFFSRQPSWMFIPHSWCSSTSSASCPHVPKQNFSGFQVRMTGCEGHVLGSKPLGFFAYSWQRKKIHILSVCTYCSNFWVFCHSWNAGKKSLRKMIKHNGLVWSGSHKLFVLRGDNTFILNKNNNITTAALESWKPTGWLCEPELVGIQRSVHKSSAQNKLYTHTQSRSKGRSRTNQWRRSQRNQIIIIRVRNLKKYYCRVRKWMGSTNYQGKSLLLEPC